MDAYRLSTVLFLTALDRAIQIPSQDGFAAIATEIVFIVVPLLNEQGPDDIVEPGQQPISERGVRVVGHPGVMFGPGSGSEREAEMANHGSHVNSQPSIRSLDLGLDNSRILVKEASESL